MKKNFKSFSAISFTALGLLVGISLTGYTMAQEGDSVLVQKIDTLVEALTLVVTNQKIANGEDLNKISVLHYSSDVINPDCLDGFLSWPKSQVRKNNADWDTLLIPKPDYAHYTLEPRQFLDLNGDGLIDYLYQKKTLRSYDNGSEIEAVNRTQACVLLNNGSGWNIAFQCVSQAETQPDGSRPHTYYGDCAQL